MFGYRPAEVDAAIAARDAAIAERTAGLVAARGELEASRARMSELGRAADRLADLVVARERELREAKTQLEHERTWGEGAMRSLLVLAAALERVGGSVDRPRADADRSSEGPEAGESPAPTGEGNAGRVAEDVFVGSVELEVGPLSDFAQLVGFEDAAGAIDATREISVKRFTAGRATLEMKLGEPVELLRELEERAPFEFKVRDLRADRLVLDVDDE